ncbi:MAG: SCO family protein [Steroidobacteraceae bacterium]
MDEPRFGHESPAIPVARLLRIGAVLAVGVIVTVAAVFIALRFGPEPEPARVAPHGAVIPPAPRLQAHPTDDLAEFHAQKQSLLESWGWTDRSEQFAHIPIERAMALYAGQSGSAKPSAAEPRRDGARKLLPPPNLLAHVGFEQRLGAAVPLGLEFRDSRGEALRLGVALGGRPTLLVPGYFRCTNLCDVVRAGVAQAVTAIGLQAGQQFNVLLFSIDPRESPADAAAAQESDARTHPRAQVPRWRYLTGTAATAAALARAIGFRYLFDPRNGQYAHTAGIVLLSPRGVVSQYLLGIQFAPLTLRLALVNASHGHIGSLVDRLLLVCCDYDPSTGRYSLAISRVLQGLGLLTAAMLALLVIVLRRAERRAPSSGARP